MSITRAQAVINGKPLVFETGKLAEQAGGAVTVRYGDTIVFAAATVSPTIRPGIDFFPLTVDFEERLYAAGKIPGSSRAARAGRPRRASSPHDSPTDPSGHFSRRGSATTSRSSSRRSAPTRRTNPTSSR